MLITKKANNRPTTDVEHVLYSIFFNVFIEV